jgi:hypothetical protein
MKKSFTREDLYRLVWAQPLRTVAHEFGISDVALAKTCRKANVPIAPRGFWARKQAGQAVAAPPLPLRFPGASDTVGSEPAHYYSGPDWREKILANPVPPVPRFDEDVTTLRKRVCRLVGRVEFYADLSKKHPLISRLWTQDEERKAQYVRHKYSWHEPRFESGVGLRWLTLLNSLSLTFQRLGCAVSTSLSQYAPDNFAQRDIGITIGTIHFTAFLAPVTTAGRDKQIVDGLRMRFSIRRPGAMKEMQSWEIGGGKQVATQLAEIIQEILVAAEMEYRQAAVANRERWVERKARLEKEIVELKLEEERKMKEELKQRRREQIEQLTDQANQFTVAAQIRSYVTDAQVHLAGTMLPPDSLKTWSKWALSQADHIDPTKNGVMLECVKGFCANHTSD